MTRTEIEIKYFEWMYNLVSNNRYAEINSYRKLLEFLHDTEFRYIIPKDENREHDGENLRLQFAYEKYDQDEAYLVIDMLSRPCSVLEMMIALAIRCEDIMDDPRVGNRTGQWFWKMIVTLGLGDMYDSRYDKEKVRDIVNTFLKREYQRDGQGSLFRVKNHKNDFRKFEIWIQMLWYLDTLV